MEATFEIYRGGRWQAAATLTPVDQTAGIAGACRFEYDTAYAIDTAGPETAQAAGLSCRYPVDFQLHSLPHWPAFALDILPSGYGRRQWLGQLDLQDGPGADWPLLLAGTAFPPGNLRVAEAIAARDFDTLVPTAAGDVVAMKDHPGFARDRRAGAQRILCRIRVSARYLCGRRIRCSRSRSETAARTGSQGCLARRGPPGRSRRCLALAGEAATR